MESYNLHISHDLLACDIDSEIRISGLVQIVALIKIKFLWHTTLSQLVTGY